MKQASLVWEGITIGLVFLLISVSFFSLAGSTTPEKKENMVTVSLEAIGLPGLRPQSVQLPVEQYQKFKTFIDGLQVRLNNAETPQATLEVLYDTVAELEQVGLLPSTRIAHQVKALVFRYWEAELNRPITSAQKTEENRFCVLVGLASNVDFWGPLQFSLMVGIDRLSWFLWNHGNFVFYPLLLILGMGLYAILKETNLFGGIAFGRTCYEYLPQYHLPQPVDYPAHGWVWTKGASGIVTWNDTFFGQLNTFQIANKLDYIGVRGFTGFRIGLGLGITECPSFIIGSTGYVKLASAHPLY
jgi:hypothetical protein